MSTFTPFLSPARSRSGSALITAMMTVAIIGIVAATTISMASARYGAVFQASSWQESLQGAEAAADMAMAGLNTGSWTSWQTVSSSTIPRGQPSGGSSVSGSTPPSTGHYYYLIPPNITHVGEGNNTVRMYVTVDPANLPLDSNGNQWYRIRATGIAGVPGVPRISAEKLDNDLRKISLLYDRVTGAAVAKPEVRRSVEIIAAPAAQSQWVRGLTLRGQITTSGSAWIDSFDSGNPLKSTNGAYDVTKRQSHGDIATVNSGANSVLNGGNVYGNLTYSGSPVKGVNLVTGAVTTPFNQTISPVLAPTWAAGSYTTSPTIPANITGMYTLQSGTANHPALYKMSLIQLSGSNFLTLQATNSGNNNNYIEIWVTGNLVTSGTSYIKAEAGVNVKIHVGGDVVLSGSSIQNNGQTADKVAIDCISPLDGSKNKVDISGSGNLTAVINAPDSNITMSGTATLSGAMIGNTLTMSGGAGLHYDEALKGTGGSASTSNYSYASWFEDIR